MAAIQNPDEMLSRNYVASQEYLNNAKVSLYNRSSQIMNNLIELKLNNIQEKPNQILSRLQSYQDIKEEELEQLASQGLLSEE